MVTRWWVVLCAAILWDTASLQQNNDQKPECCPCPKDASGDSLASDMAASGTTGVRAAQGLVDDCPCRFRDADSVGAPSMFFPTAVRAVRPFINLEDSQGNPDPLLHPEVNLASSVLETLRKATDEEYEDALARDAARSAIDGDAAESARSLVTVIINPKDSVSEDDVMSDASHVHEARCINPSLGRSILRSSAYKPILLTDILNLPKKKSPSLRSWNLFDLDNGIEASNVNERVVEPVVNNDQKFKSAIAKPDLSLDIKPLTSLEKLGLKIPRLNIKNERSSLNTQSGLPKLRPPSKIEIPHVSSLLPKFNTPNFLRRSEDDKDDKQIITDSDNKASIFKERFTGFAREKSKNYDVTNAAKPEPQSKIEIPSMPSIIAKLNKPNSPQLNKYEYFDDTFDSQNAPSIIKEQFRGFQDDKIDDDAKLKKEVQKKAGPSFKTSSTTNFGAKAIPTLNIAPPSSRDATTDVLSNLLKGLQVPNLSDLFSSNLLNLRNNDQDIKSTEQKKPVVTEILDTVPSPSEIKSDHTFVNTVQQEDTIDYNINTENDEIQKMIDQNPIKTEIIDHVPDSSNINEFNGAEIKILSDPDTTAKVNSIVSEDLYDEMQINNEDVIDDSRVIESNRRSEFGNLNCSENMELNLNNDAINKGITTDNIIESKDDNPSAVSDLDNGLNFENNLDKNKSLPLRERIRNTLDNLKKLTKINHNDNQVETEESTSSESKDIVSNEEQLPSESENIESEPIKTQILDNLPPKEEMEKLQIEDLQQMSDSLLDKENFRGDSLSEDNKVEQNMKIDTKDEFKSEEVLVDESQSLTENLNHKDNDNNLMTKNNSNAIECFEASPTSGLKAQNPNSDAYVNKNEMSAEPSERVTNIIEPDDKLRTPLRQSIALQPPTLSDLNLLNLPTLDVKNLLKEPLPTFKLTDILNVNAKNDDNFFTRDDDTEDLNIKQRFSPSTSSFRSVLPPLQPLENMNLDILQLNPLTSELPTIPRLNLNSFKSKLAIPESLQLKPLILESSVGSKNGVLGASLSFGNDDKKDMTRSNMLGEASLKKPSLLGRPLGSLPTLDELHNTMLENAQNLFSTPLETTGRNVFEDTLRSGQILTDNFRVEAENTVKDIQRNLESTLKGVTNHGFLSSPSLKSPHDVFEELSRKHEDVNDKLKGISYDLSDRLETLRNNFFDEYRFPSFGSNLLFNNLGSIPTLGSPMPRQNGLNKSKPKSSTLSSKAKKVTTSSNSGPKGKFISRSSVDKNKNKMPAAASIPKLKTVTSPKLRNAQSPIFNGLGKEATRSRLLTKERPTLSLFPKLEKNTIDTSRPLFKKPSIPKLAPSKVKISFSTTPSPPIFKNKSRFKEIGAKSSSTKSALNLPKLPKSYSRGKPSLLNSFRDSSGHASEPISLRVKAPFEERKGLKDLKLPIIAKTATTMETDDNEDFTALVSSPKPKTNPQEPIKPRPPTLNKTYLSNSDHLKQEENNSKPPLVFGSANEKDLRQPLGNLQRVPPMSWPKTIDETFLVKVREALRARLADISQSLNTSAISRKSNSNSVLGSVKTPGDADMARSASNNVDTIQITPQAMQENTSYTCKMSCTKNS